MRSPRVAALLVVSIAWACWPSPDDFGPLPQFDSFETIVYGDVRLTSGAAAGANIPVYVTPHETWCGGRRLTVFGDSTATDDNGHYHIRLSTWRDFLPATAGSTPSFCTEIRSAAPGSSDTVRVQRHLPFRIVPTDSTRVDLVLP